MPILIRYWLSQRVENNSFGLSPSFSSCLVSGTGDHYATRLPRYVLEYAIKGLHFGLRYFIFPILALNDSFVFNATYFEAPVNIYLMCGRPSLYVSVMFNFQILHVLLLK